MQQQRKWPRVALKAQVQMRFSSVDAMLRGSLRDLSAGGAFVYCRSPRPVGTMIRLLVRVEDSDLSFEAEGEIVRVLHPEQAVQQGKPPGMGLRFIDLSPENRSVIIKLVSMTHLHHQVPNA